MSLQIRFTVPGPPLAKQRARGGNGTHYTPDQTVRYENLVRTEAAKAMEILALPLLEGPVLLQVVVFRPIPPSWSKKRQAAALEQRWDTRKPDFDNFAKIVADALNGVVWKDDAQVVQGWQQKLFTDGAPSLHVRVEAL